MDREAERELDAVISEEKAKIVLGGEYATMPYLDWVDELKTFVTTQICVDCGAGFNLDEPEEEMWGWYVDGQDDDVEELEVVLFFCENCMDMSEEERELNHPKGWGMLIFRRQPTGTFPLEEDDDASEFEDGEYEYEYDLSEDDAIDEIDLSDDVDLEHRDEDD